jgi:hypothetical protein
MITMQTSRNTAPCRGRHGREGIARVRLSPLVVHPRQTAKGAADGRTGTRVEAQLLEEALRRAPLPLRQLGLSFENSAPAARRRASGAPESALVGEPVAPGRSMRTISRAIIGSRTMRLIPLPLKADTRDRLDALRPPPILVPGKGHLPNLPAENVRNTRSFIEVGLLRYSAGRACLGHQFRQYILVSAASRRGAVSNGYRPSSSKFHDVDQGREATASTTRDDVMISQSLNYNVIQRRGHKLAVLSS